MNSQMYDDVRARKWAQDFDEVAERSSPPDRLEAILHRAEASTEATIFTAEERTSLARLWPAALVFLGVAVTIGVSVLPDTDVSVPATAPAVTHELQGKQGKKKTEKEAIPPKKRKDTAKSLKDQEQSAQEFLRAQRAAELQRKLTTERALINQLSKVKAAQEAIKKDPKGILGRLIQDEALEKNLAKRMNLLRKTEMLYAESLRASTAAKTNPLLKGDYAAALQKLSQQRSKLNTTKDPAAARKILDEMTRSIGTARRALWDAKGAKQPEGKKDR